MAALDSYLEELLCPAADPCAGDVRQPVPMLRRAPTVETTDAAPAPTSADGPARVADVRAVPTVGITRGHAAIQPGRWLRVAVDGDHYAMELLRVQEVTRVAPITAMRGTAPAMLGVMNLRGRVVPVFDLGRWLGAGQVHVDDRARIVVIESENELLGLLVSAVEDVVTLDAAGVEAPFDVGPQRRRVIDRTFLGVARPGGVPTVLLDTAALFA